MLSNHASENQQIQPSTKKQDFRIKTTRLLNSCPREKTSQSESHSRASTSRPSTILTQSPNLTLWQKNTDFHEKRRQNQLNSMFRIRKEKLEAITKFNKEFYFKLNTQQSHYPCKPTSKQKDLNLQQPLTFRTVDSAASRQILGPILNFNPLFGMNSSRLSTRANNQKENTLRELETLSLSRNLRQCQAFCTPLRMKLGMKPNPQKDQNLPLKERSPKLKLSNQSINFQSFLKTPERLSKLPQIFKIVLSHLVDGFNEKQMKLKSKIFKKSSQTQLQTIEPILQFSEMNLILEEISNFFSVVLSIYPQIPRDLNEQIKTMQAFLRSYDEKELFLIQNFVRRLQLKASKTQNHQKKKKADLKTQPSFFEQDNKQNVYNMINTYRPTSITEHIPQNNSFKLQLNGINKQPKLKDKQTPLDAEIKRYRMLFENYASNSRQNFKHNRPLSMPRQKTPSPGQLLSSRLLPKLNSSPYIETLEYQCENVNHSQSCIEPDFHSIQINHQAKERPIQKMKHNIRELKESMEANFQIQVLENLLADISPNLDQ